MSLLPGVRSFAALLLTTSALPMAAIELPAQQPGCPVLHCDPVPPRAPASGIDALQLGVNAALGALTVAVRPEGRRDGFWRGLLEGAAGGTLAYAGKRLSVESFPAAPLLGRQVSAVGASMVANAADGVPPLQSVSLPYGPVRIELWPRRTSALVFRVDAANLVLTSLAAVHPEYRLLAGESAAAGTPIFVRDDLAGAGGLHLGGLVVLDAAPEDYPLGRQHLRHEMIHVMQYDFAARAWARPAERWVLRRAGARPAVHRHVEMGLLIPPWTLLNTLIDYHDRPWEREADRLVHAPR